VADHPLRPATHRRLGGPLHRQLANGTRSHLRAVACKQRPPLTSDPCGPVVSCGISTPLGVLSPARRQVLHALLTRSPLYSRGCPLFRVRLACLIHAASVRSEPGSNSPFSNLLIETASRPPLSWKVLVSTNKPVCAILFSKSENHIRRLYRVADLISKSTIGSCQEFFRLV
jgi:hypothetical protein